jgi:hypothetical protein
MLSRMRVCCLVAFIVIAANCDDGGPTTPNGPIPEITRIDPTDVASSSSPQVFAVSGKEFTTGLTVILTTPSGTRTAVSGDAIQSLQSVSFQISVTLDTPGEYRFAVRLLNGTESNEVRVSVASPTGTAPRIDVVTPGTVQMSPNGTIVTLTGVNFSAGSTVNVVSPDGTTNVLPSSSLLSVTPTSIQLSTVFAIAGTYGLSVANQQGQLSNTVTLTAF